MIYTKCSSHIISFIYHKIPIIIIIPFIITSKKKECKVIVTNNFPKNTQPENDLLSLILIVNKFITKNCSHCHIISTLKYTLGKISVKNVFIDETR